jgi:CRP-like cAMP-binding protein
MPSVARCQRRSRRRSRRAGAAEALPRRRPGRIRGRRGPALRLDVGRVPAARVYQLAADGRRTTVERVGIGEPVLAVAALAGGRYPANVEAEDDLALIWLPRDALLGLMEAEPAAARSIATDLAARVVHLTGVIQSLSLGVPARLARFLFQQALATGRQTPGGLVIDLGMSKTALADELGTVPETLSRALGRLRLESLIETRGREIVVLDVGGLARRGAGYEEG